jgi:hypothetical protein
MSLLSTLDWSVEFTCTYFVNMLVIVLWSGGLPKRRFLLAFVVAETGTLPWMQIAFPPAERERAAFFKTGSVGNHRYNISALDIRGIGLIGCNNQEKSSK